jgi:2-methylcitrate dehydratase PrpD
VAALHGTVTLEHLTGEAVRDTAVLAAARRVERVLDRGHEGAVGRVIPMPVTVDLHTSDGRIVTRHSRVPTGHPDRDVTGRPSRRW